MKLFALLAACSLALAAPSDWLVRVELEGIDAAAVRDAGLTVIDDFGEWALARAGAAELIRAEGNLAFTGLTQNPAGRLFLYVMPAPGFDRSRIAAHGRILTEDSRGVLIETAEDEVLALNSLPVKLYRVGLEPMVFGEGIQPDAFPLVDDSLVQVLVDRVSPDSVLANINRLVAFYTRYSTTDSCRRAMEYVRERLEGYGCDSTYTEPFRPTYAPNTVGVKYGTVNPRRIYIVCGHVDNTSDVPPNRAPGADDNASGTSAVLEAARVFADVQFENTVLFIGFAGEEQGLYGSDSFATRAYRRGDSIMAVLNFDMISYGRQNRDTFEVIGKNTNPNCTWLVDSFIANVRAYTTMKTRRSIVTSAPYSDHHSFWKKGYVGFCGIERDFTPMYHTLGDTVGPLYYVNCGTNNIPMATDAIKAAVATIAKFAGATVTTGIEENPAPRPARISGIAPTVGRLPLALRLSGPARPGALLEIYDAAGRPVRSLDASGQRAIEWDGLTDSGRRVGAGIYLFRLIDGERATTAKAVVTD